MTDVELLAKVTLGGADVYKLKKELLALLEASYISRAAIREFHLSEGELVRFARICYKLGKEIGYQQGEYDGYRPDEGWCPACGELWEGKKLNRDGYCVDCAD